MQNDKSLKWVLLTGWKWFINPNKNNGIRRCAIIGISASDSSADYDVSPVMFAMWSATTKYLTWPTNHHLNHIHSSNQLQRGVFQPSTRPCALR
jgi:hypothetical protein